MKRTLFTAALGIFVLGAAATFGVRADDAAKDTRVFEIRTYHANPGKMEALNKHMREKTLPLFRKHGLTPIGFWIPKDQPNTLIYILEFKDQAARDQAVGAFFSDPEAKKGLAESEKDGPLLSSKPEIALAQPTDYYPLK